MDLVKSSASSGTALEPDNSRPTQINSSKIKIASTSLVPILARLMLI